MPVTTMAAPPTPPSAFAARKTSVYRHLTLAGSAAIALLATVWLLERMLDVKWLLV